MALKEFFYPNRIFLPPYLCNRIENLMNEYINKAQAFENYKAEIRDFQYNIFVKKHIEASRKITTEIEEKLPLIIEEIEYLFRKKLGISNTQPVKSHINATLNFCKQLRMLHRKKTMLLSLVYCFFN